MNVIDALNALTIRPDAAPVFQPPALSPAALQIGELRVLADVDSFADFLAGECYQRNNVSSDRATRLPHRLDDADTATAVHALITAGYEADAETALRAAQVLVKRYLQDNDSRIADIATDSGVL